MAVLGSIFLFSDVPADAVEGIEKRAIWRDFEAGEPVFETDGPNIHVYFIVSGVVRILRDIGPDREVVLADLKPGHFFGELAAIDGGERSARAIALEAAQLAALDRATFKDVMTTYPQVTERIMLHMAGIIRAMDHRVTQMSSLSDGQRVMSELIRMSRPDPQREGGYYIPDLPSHREIAGWAGTNRDSVARTIGELTRMGVVERRSLSLMVKDWLKLQVVATADKELRPV